MNLNIENRVALVAAGSQGIGLATAQALLEEGCKVAICSRSQEKLDEAAKSLNRFTGSLHTSVADVSKEEDIRRWVDTVSKYWSSPDILVTNTGGPPTGFPSELSDQAWTEGIDSTLMNIVRMVRDVLPGMKAKKWGRIVHITSLVAKHPSLNITISSTLRAGISALTKLQAKEFGAYGITVNGVLPGHTLTDRQTHLIEYESKRSGKSQEAILEERSKMVGLKRLAKPEEIASVIAFLCSTQASYLSGESLLVDGAI